MTLTDTEAERAYNEDLGQACFEVDESRVCELVGAPPHTPLPDLRDEFGYQLYVYSHADDTEEVRSLSSKRARGVADARAAGALPTDITPALSRLAGNVAGGRAGGARRNARRCTGMPAQNHTRVTSKSPF